MVVALIAVSCVYPFDIMPEGNDSRLVIAGDINVGDISRFTVTKVVAIGEQEVNVPVSISVKASGGSVYKAKRVINDYVVDLTGASANEEYKLLITRQDDGREYETSWKKPLPAPVIDSISYVKDEKNVTILLSADGGASQHFKWDFEETYEYHAEYRAFWLFDPTYKPEDPEQDPEDPSKIYIRNPNPYENYYCWRTLNSVELGLASTIVQTENKLVDYPVTTVGRSTLKLQTMYSINVKMRCISPDAYLFLDNIRTNSNISGDLFSPVPSDVRGNIRCMSDSTEWVVGYVDVCQVNSSRFFIDNEKELVYIKDYAAELPLFIPEADDNGIYHFSTHYYNGNRPVELDGNDPFPNKKNVKWGSARCIDCRAMGGTKEKPDYWPNDHQ